MCKLWFLFKFSKDSNWKRFFRSTSRKYTKLETQVLTLAKSVSQLSTDIQMNYILSDQVESMRHEMEQLKRQMMSMHQSMMQQQQQQQQNQSLSSNHHHNHQNHANTLPNGSTNNFLKKDVKKVDKFKRFVHLLSLISNDSYSLTSSFSPDSSWTIHNQSNSS